MNIIYLYIIYFSHVWNEFTCSTATYEKRYEFLFKYNRLYIHLDFDIRFYFEIKFILMKIKLRNVRLFNLII